MSFIWWMPVQRSHIFILADTRVDLGHSLQGFAHWTISLTLRACFLIQSASPFFWCVYCSVGRCALILVILLVFIALGSLLLSICPYSFRVDYSFLWPHECFSSVWRMPLGLFPHHDFSSLPFTEFYLHTLYWLAWEFAALILGSRSKGTLAVLCAQRGSYMWPSGKGKCRVRLVISIRVTDKEMEVAKAIREVAMWTKGRGGMSRQRQKEKGEVKECIQQPTATPDLRRLRYKNPPPKSNQPI